VTRRIWLAALALACGPSERPPPPTAPARIVSQAVLADEILWALGPSVRSRVVGVSRMVDDGRYSPIAGVWPEDVARVDSRAEAVLAHAPELVILASFSAAETRTMLERAGVALVTIERMDGFADYRQAVRAVGRGVGDPDAAERLVADFDARLDRLERAPEHDAPALLGWNDGNIAGAGTTFDDETRAAGGRNVASERGVTGHARISTEQLLAWDPEWLVVPCGELPCGEAERAITDHALLGVLGAARERRVVAVPSRVLYSTGAQMLDVVEILRTRTEERR
jgi:iron complex transport system substrate-binding protein